MKKPHKLSSNQARTLLRFAIIVAALLLLSLLIILKMLDTTIFRADEWRADAEKALSDTTIIKPERGSILAHDGSILACNLEVYDISIDLQHPKIKPANKIIMFFCWFVFIFKKFTKIQNKT